MSKKVVFSVLHKSQESAENEVDHGENAYIASVIDSHGPSSSSSLSPFLFLRWGFLHSLSLFPL